MLRNINSPFDRTSPINRYGLVSGTRGIRLNLGSNIDRIIGDRIIGKFLPPKYDGWVDGKGHLIYNENLINSDGSKGGYTKYASAEDIKYGELLWNLGDTGRKQFNALVNSTLKIQVDFSNLNVLAFLGTTNENDFDGNSWTITVNKKAHALKETFESWELPYINYGMGTGNYKGRKFKAKTKLTMFELYAMTFGHEIAHANKKNLALKRFSDDKKNPGNLHETRPYELSRDMYLERVGRLPMETARGQKHAPPRSARMRNRLKIEEIKKKKRIGKLKKLMNRRYVKK